MYDELEEEDETTTTKQHRSECTNTNDTVDSGCHWFLSRSIVSDPKNLPGCPLLQPVFSTAVRTERLAPQVLTSDTTTECPLY